MTTNGTYLSTLMMPDTATTPNSVPNSEIVALGSTYRNISADGYKLVFYGYNVSRPYSWQALVQRWLRLCRAPRARSVGWAAYSIGMHHHLNGV